MTFDESPLIFVGETNLPTTHGTLVVKAFRNQITGQEPLAILCSVESQATPIVRVHDACFTSEVLGSLKCDCKAQLNHAIQTIQREGGIVIYLHQEGRGIGLANKIAAYGLQEQGFDTVDANRHLHLPDDAREYQDAASILEYLGIQRIQLLTNNPRKVELLQNLGIEIVQRLPSEVQTPKESIPYLQTKIERMGHLLNPNSLGTKTPTD
jgi:GTP cyclohydrolase II